MKKNLDEVQIILYYQRPVIKKKGGENEQKQNHIPRWSRASYRIDS